MAPPSPRRSSRARATNAQSSSSSGASVRVERSTRNNKTSSGKSTPSASLSSEPLDDFDDTLLGRRRKRGQDEETDKSLRTDNTNTADGSDDAQDEEDEAVRCICGSEEYPGRPPIDGPDADIFAGIELTEDVTGFFVQCDVCKVWQHGACLGIFSAESSPDEYFCEQCRKDLHKIHTASNGQKYSKYLPLHRNSQATSRAASITKDGTRSPKPPGSKNSRPTSSSQSKRRSTMNSRDAAYDDEQLLRAIEASKEDNTTDGTESTLRRTKRGRSDSEEYVATALGQLAHADEPRNVVAVKRQRTNSQSESPVLEHNDVPTPDQSDDESQTRNSKRARNGRNTREKSEKDDKERQRLEAVNKRKGRADRRRGEEDTEESEEAPLAVSKPQSNPEEPINNVETTPAPPTPGTPPTNHTAVVSSHKRGVRSTHKKGAKAKAQVTHSREVSPARSLSRDILKNGDEPVPTSHQRVAPVDAKPKPKAGPTHKMSMLDMRRRVAAIMDFISRTQVDLAAEGSLPSSSSSSGDSSPRKTPTHVNGINGVYDFDKQFKDLSCVEMMDALTRDMVKWQNQYA